MTESPNIKCDTGWASIFLQENFGFTLKDKFSADYIKPCSRSAKNFDQCCVERGNEALPHLLKGDSDLKLPNMLPMKLPKIDVDAGSNVKLGFTDVDVYGLDTVKLSTFQ